VNKIFYKKLKTHLLEIYVIFIYIALTLLMTYPLIFKLNFYLTGDTSAGVWSFWWIKYSIFNKTNIFYTNHLYHPIGLDLSLFPLSYFNIISSLPLQFFFNEIVTHNIMVLFSFVMSGFGTFLLVKYLTKDTKAAFISGVIFAFSPFRFGHLMGHLSIISTEWIPFFVLYLIKTIKEKNLKNAVFAGAFFSLSALSEWHYLLFLSIFSSVMLLYYFKTEKKLILNINFLKKITLFSLVFLLITFPFFLPLINGALSNPQATRPLETTIITSADLFAFFIPSELHPLFGGFVSGINNMFIANLQERNVFLGYIPIILSVYSLFKVEKIKTKFWILFSVIFFILSLGPLLHVFGRFLFPSPMKIGDFTDYIGLNLSQTAHDLLNNFIAIPLPYIALHKFIPLLRTPSRFTILVILSVSVLSGYSMAKIFKKQNNLIFLLILFLILFEFLAIPLKLEEIHVPSFYSQMADDEEDYAILEVPVDFTPIYYGNSSDEILENPDYMLLQTYHNKRLLTGSFTRKQPNATYFIDTTPLLLEMRNPQPIKKVVYDRLISKVISSNPEASDIFKKYLESLLEEIDYKLIDNTPSQKDIQKLKNNNVKFIIIHKYYLDQENYQKINNILRNLIDEPLYENEELIVYEI